MRLCPKKPQEKEISGSKVGMSIPKTVARIRMVFTDTKLGFALIASQSIFEIIQQPLNGHIVSC